jgi:hypothetical protein
VNGSDGDDALAYDPLLGGFHSVVRSHTML